MTFLQDLHNPPPTKGSLEEHYGFFNSSSDVQEALFFISNPTVLTNGNFASGGVLITQADGDNAEFYTGWKVVGAAGATYTLTPATYPLNSTINSSSATYSHVEVSSFTGAFPLYFYQRQSNTVRKYQRSPLTYGIFVKNNQSKVITIRLDIFSFYDGSSSVLKTGKAIYLQPGLTKITSTTIQDSLSGLTVGAGAYTEFRLNLIDLEDGTADIDMYYIKCEFGKISTLFSA